MKHWSDYPTPSLLLDLAKVKRNIARMQRSARENNVSLRPHIKTHKSLNIAGLQEQEGACGFTVATLSEAEVMIEGGFSDILLAFPLSDREKCSRLAALSKSVRLIATVDEAEHAALLSEAAEAHTVQLEVWIKVNAGLNRCGTEPGEETAELAEKLQSYERLKLKGLYTHAGHAYGAKGEDHRKNIAHDEARAVLLSAAACEKRGIRIEHRSVGSTPTYEISGAHEGITEVRPGNAVLFDGVQAGLGVCSLEECALTVSATVASRKNGRIIFDAGSKSLTLEKGAHGNDSIKGFGTFTEPEALKGREMTRLSEEHGILDGTGDVSGVSLGEKVRIIPNHACTAVNLYDRYLLVEDDTVVGEWEVDARGRNQ
ncbi:alanine racemase [Alteribacter natronophilus]|uniref:alanine racemase n=1 Tax=Alteribacter natronophilus TaxID=2583810 RepID=UPI00110F6364|nr:alanine racemase [Alteribacter natronophilus]TMW70636.1 D-TA family PLP-dependent enzyme [Alteribacter natronophilus]